jgi:hypothetical protein
MADDRVAWEVRGSVASVKKELAEWDPEQQYWKPATHFTVASFRPDGAVSSTDSYNPDGSISHSVWIYAPSGRLVQSNSWMNDRPQHSALYKYDATGRQTRTVSVDEAGTETDTEVYSYDAEGKRTKICALPLHKGIVHYGIEGTDMSLGAPGATRSVTSYDDRDLPVRIILQDQNQKPVREVILTRDNEGKLVEVETRMGAQPMFSCDSGCAAEPMSPEGEQALTVLMRALGGAFSRTQYVYDNQGRLVEKTSSMFNLGGDRTTFGYAEGNDPIEQICEQSSREANLDDGGSLQYTAEKITTQYIRFDCRYDARGNWVEKTVSTRPDANAEFQPSNIMRRVIIYHQL